MLARREGFEPPTLRFEGRGGCSSGNPASTAHADRVIDLDAYTLAAIRP